MTTWLETLAKDQEWSRHEHEGRSNKEDDCALQTIQPKGIKTIKMISTSLAFTTT